MTYQNKVLSFTLLVAMSLSAGNLAAETGQGVRAQNIYSGAAEEIERGDQLQLKNSGDQDQLRNRLNEQDKENARKARFENQLKEKARLVRSVNEHLDSRIISMNLLLNRAEAQIPENLKNEDLHRNHILDQQEAILKMYGENHAPEEIAKSLSLPRGEVDLVIDLKKKFSAGS